MEKWQTAETLALWFGIVLFFVLVLVLSIILLVRLNYQKIIKQKENEAALKLNHQRALLENSLRVQEKERKRIAADLHDELIGQLTALKLQNQVAPDAKTIDEMAHRSITTARRISHDLSPPLIEHSPIHEVIDDVLQPWKLKFKLSFDADIRDLFQLSARKKLQLIRILQEILTNAEKHAEATAITIYLRQTAKSLILSIEDNGKGIEMSKIKPGLGLTNIETRVQYIQGKFKLKSSKGKGAKFIFILLNT